MIEQFSFDIQLIFAILNGKVSAAINRKLSRNFRQNGVEITPEQWTVLLFLWEKDGVTQQELCNATFKAGIIFSPPQMVDFRMGLNLNGYIGVLINSF